MKQVLIAVVAFIVCYLGCAFIEWNINANFWSIGARGFVIMLWLFSSWSLLLVNGLKKRRP